MTGKCIPESNLIVTKTLTSVIINPYLRRQNEVVPCIGCGKCSSVCPMKLTPTQILFYYNKNEKEELKKLKANLCIKCGLCSYICPSRIDLTIITSKASDLIRRG
jgi:electron transport complex protein RnfC